MHLVYGITLDVTYVAVGRGALEEHDMSPIDQHVQYKSQRAMATSVVSGVVLGGFVGSILAAAPRALLSMDMGVYPWFFVIGEALICGIHVGLAFRPA